MSQDKNPFGGGNPHGLYVPMSEDEQEVISRLVESQDLEVVVEGWGISPNPQIIFGDLRVTVPITMEFDGLEKPTSLHFLDLELRTQSGMTIFKQRMPVNPPIIAHNGMVVDMAWDIAIDHMDPDFVKMIKPGAIGWTTRRLDKVTKERTTQGNMHLTSGEKDILRWMDERAEQTRASDVDLLAKFEEEDPQ